MNTVLAPLKRLVPKGNGQAAGQRPMLWVVPKANQRMSTVSFVLLVIGVLVTGLVGVLVLNTQIQSQSAQLTKMQREAKELSYQAANLKTEYHQLSSVSALASKAKRLGMVPNIHPAFIDLSTGEVIGSTKTAGSDEMKQLTRQISAPAKLPALSYGQPDTAKPAESASSTQTKPANAGVVLNSQPTASPATQAKPAGEQVPLPLAPAAATTATPTKPTESP